MTANGYGNDRAGRIAVTTPLSAINVERIQWLVPERIPIGGVTVVAGEPGLGKSTFASAYLAAQITRGETTGALAGIPADVLILSAEDTFPHVIKPRLMAAGADLTRVHRFTVHDDGFESLFALPDDMPLLEDRLVELRETGHHIALLIVDPVGAFLADRVDSHKDASVRRALGPLALVAELSGLAAVAVMHLNKDQAQRLVMRVMGSVGFVGAARSILAFARDPDDPDGERGAQRVIAHAKSNWGGYAPTLAAHLESAEVDAPDDPEPIGTSRLVIDGEVDIGVEDLSGTNRADSGPGDTEEAVAAQLHDSDGQSAPSRTVKKAVAGDLGCSIRTVERAAIRMEAAGELTIEWVGFPGYTIWTLATAATPPEEPVVAARSVATTQTRIPEPNAADSNGKLRHTRDVSQQGPDDPSVPCPDPAVCRYRDRHPNGPWGCAHNHPEAQETRP